MKAPGAENAIGITNFDDGPPYTLDPVGGAFAKMFDERASGRGLAVFYPRVDSQAANEYAPAGKSCRRRSKEPKSLDDAKLAAWLEHNQVETVIGKRGFTGAHHTSEKDLTQLASRFRTGSG